MHCISILTICFLLASADNIVVDADSDCFYVPQLVDTTKFFPGLIVLGCTGATLGDLDSLRPVADSLNIIMATCHRSRNHRSFRLNDSDIMRTYEKLVCNYPVDTRRIFVYGFSGMGVQALAELFLHPEDFCGVVAVCAHKGALDFIQPAKLHNRLFYFISRIQDWNLDDNRFMRNLLRGYGIKDTLVISEGEHSPPSQAELLDALIWLLKYSKGHNR